MNPTDPTQQTPTPAPIHNPLAVMQPGESVVCEIKRHPIGILSVYGFSGVLLIVVLILVILAPHFVNGNRNTIMAIGLGVFLLFALLCLGFVFIANKVYWGNRWILTTDSVTQVTQNSLFDKQSSQLSLGNLEDVTAEQSGILPHMFNYGALKVETAGERSKFVFLYCPNPNYYATQILNVRERFEQNRRAGNPQSLYRGEADYSPPTPANQQSDQPAPPSYGNPPSNNNGNPQ